MSDATIASQAESADQFYLRWSDSPESPFREEPVEVIGLYSSEPVVRSARRVSEETEVFLIGKKYTGNGIVRSCQSEGPNFLLTIHIGSEYMTPELLPEYDPGLFAVDDFLTEEEEAKILESLNSSSGTDKESSSFREKADRIFQV